MPKLIWKHQFSGASDAFIDFEVDHENKVVTVAMMDARRRPMLSTAGLEAVIFQWLPEQDVIAFNNDDNGEWTPTRTGWKVIASLGDQKFLVEAWQQRPAAGFHAVEIALRPFSGDEHDPVP